MCNEKPKPKEVSSKKPECVVTAIIRNDDGEVLMTQRTRKPKAGMWHLPGGAVEFREGVYDALVREIKEELGIRIRVSNPRPLAICSSHYPDVDRHIISLYFEAEIVEGTPAALDGTKDWRFVSFEAAAALHADGLLLDSCRKALGDAVGWRII